MRKIYLCLAVVACFCVASLAKDKVVFPQEIVVARYVAVTTIEGSSITLANPDDRQAVADVENAIRKWKRYTVVIRPEDADIVIAVRRGNIASVSGGFIIRANKPGVTTGATAGSPDDTLQVFSGHTRDPLSGPSLWRYSSKDCLDSPDVPAVTKLRNAVESAEKQHH
jgi:hypothetical protein